MVDMTGRVALITGSSRGIGRGCAVEMARAGADIAVNYHSHPEDAEDVANEVRAQGREAIVVQADVSDRAAVDRMVEAAVNRFGRLDIVVANAYYSKREPFLELSTEAVRRTWEVCLWGSFHTASGRRAGRWWTRVAAAASCSSVPCWRRCRCRRPWRTIRPKRASTRCAVPSRLNSPRTVSAANVIEPGYTDTPGERQFATDEQIKEAARRIAMGPAGHH